MEGRGEGDCNKGEVVKGLDGEGRGRNTGAVLTVQRARCKGDLRARFLNSPT